MTAIIVKVNPMLRKDEQDKIEQELRESINRQRNTGVIVLPNYASFEAEVNAKSCDTCPIAATHNLEDDDSPCLDCGEE